jgi:hypothetical protein
MASDWLIHRFCALRQSPTPRIFGLASRVRACPASGFMRYSEAILSAPRARPKRAQCLVEGRYEDDHNVGADARRPPSIAARR